MSSLRHMEQQWEPWGKMHWSIPQGPGGMTQPNSGFKISQVPFDPSSMPLPFSFIFPFLGQNLVERAVLTPFTCTIFLWLSNDTVSNTADKYLSLPLGYGTR